MAFSPTDPVLAHSLWLQLRSTQRKPRRSQWRSDWMPLWVVLLLISILAVFAMLLPPVDTFERAERAITAGATDQQSLVLGATVSP